MASKRVNDRIKLAREVAEAGRTHATQAAAAVVALLAEVGIEQPDEAAVTSLAEGLASVLDSTADTMASADDAYEAEQLDDTEPRARRDETVEQLRSAMVQLRGTISTVAGDRAARAVGFVGSTPFDGDALARLARNVVRNLRAQPPQPEAPGVTLDVEAATRGITALAQAAEQALEDVAREHREAQGAMIARDRAMETHDERYRAIALVYEGMLRIAGLAELADRLRPTTRRSPSVEPDAPPPTAE